MKELEPQAEDLRNECYKMCEHIEKIPFNYLKPTHIVMQAIVDIVERDLGILLDESSLHYERFMTHIKFLIQRIYRKELLSSEDRELSLLMQRKYPREYQCSLKVAEYIMQATGSRLSEEEIMYLSVHIRRVSTIDL